MSVRVDRAGITLVMAATSSWQARSGLRRSRRAGTGPARRQERRQIHQTESSDERWQQVGKICNRIDTGEPARAEDREGDRGALATRVGALTRRFFLVRAARTWSFSTMPLHRHVALLEEATERDLVIGEVAQGYAERRGRLLVLIVYVTPHHELVPDRLASLFFLTSVASGSRSRISTSIS